ncbi:uncharacterized protein LOC117651055 isoform X1 [Thrips palmi]|uniref:Uncharacterized protein LOC117651055 isoform X1 n=1 Tax=Thrips palmi TaxID=161013 RepID=A0A6P8ZZS1_THRPL|nr:uncharacterized protein LOC117651055 isoform X1 [Thrips palmi]
MRSSPVAACSRLFVSCIPGPALEKAMCKRMAAMEKSFRTFIFNAFVIYFVVLYFGVHGKTINSYAGPWNVVVEKMYDCGAKHNWSVSMRFSHYNPARHSELQHARGWFNATTPMTDDTWMHVALDAWSNNMWKENAFVFKFSNHGCSVAWKYVPDVLQHFFPGARHTSPCIPVGLYETDAPVRWSVPSIPVMVYGQYRYRMSSGYLQQPAEAIICIEGRVIPKTY